MISQILNRQFILEQLEDVKAELEQQAKGEEARRGADAVPAGAEDLATDDYQVAFEAVSESIEKESKQPSGQLEFDQPDEERRSGEESALIEDLSFFSRDPVVSNLQSALEEYFETINPGALAKTTTEFDGRRGGDDGWPSAADYTIKGYEPRRDNDGRRVFNKFSVTDPRWVSSALSMGLRLFKGKHEFIDRPATPKPIASRSRILIVGDWGSGLSRAEKVATQMRKVLDQGESDGLQQHVIHLGDIYYSGWKREVKNHFLKPWPVRTEEAAKITSWSVNANHDMYSGGHAYYNTLLNDPRFRGHEGSSLFSLENKNWRILGLDTGWEEHTLKDPQPQWIREQINKADQAGQKVILLSHHQLFSAFEKGGEHMVAALGNLLEKPKIHSWFWGHEHRCALYKPHMNIQYARLVGHGGVPVYQWKKQSDPVAEPALYEYRGRFRKGLEQWALFGFAALDFDGPNIHVRYINEEGEEHHSETIL
jgi:hypothetical protein